MSNELLRRFHVLAEVRHVCIKRGFPNAAAVPRKNGDVRAAAKYPVLTFFTPGVSVSKVLGNSRTGTLETWT